jgi:dihydropteroate synthase
MGVLNLTPDSFSDGGRYLNSELGLKHALRMVEEGATLIDVGGESTRPGSQPVSLDEELSRVIPLIERLAQRVPVPISVDTSKPVVMREAVAAGAGMINDIMALQQPGALEAVSEVAVPVCLMHMQGEPRTMQDAPNYGSVVDEVKAFLRSRIDAGETAGIARHNMIVDPGFGFGKRLEHNLTILKNLPELGELAAPVLVGVSRKSMIGSIIGDVAVEQRLIGSVAAAMIAVLNGAAIVRVHDVRETVDALKVVLALRSAR